jgi:hypothetical protein
MALDKLKFLYQNPLDKDVNNNDYKDDNNDINVNDNDDDHVGSNGSGDDDEADYDNYKHDDEDKEDNDDYEDERRQKASKEQIIRIDAGEKSEQRKNQQQEQGWGRKWN